MSRSAVTLLLLALLLVGSVGAHPVAVAGMGVSIAAPPLSTDPTAPPAATGASNGAGAAGFGMTMHFMWYSTAQAIQELDQLREAGLTVVRFDLAWRQVEPDRKGEYDPAILAKLDTILGAMDARGIRPIITVIETPAWARQDRGGKFMPATDLQDYADVMGMLAQRYAARPQMVWEIWNEPNLIEFWETGPDAARYADMLRRAHAAIKAAAPTTIVLGGSIAFNDLAYLRTMYANGARGTFDGLALHPYAPGLSPDDRSAPHSNFGAVEEMRAIMVANNEPEKSIWITEMGWGRDLVTEETRARYLARAVELVRGWSYVRAFCVYTLNQNVGPDAPRFGLYNPERDSNPSWEAYTRAAGNSRGRWTTVQTLGQARTDHTATRLISGEVLVAGGYGSTGFYRSATRFNPSLGRWSAAASMLQPRLDHSATLLKDGRVLVAGGYGGDSGSLILSTAEVYDPLTDTWTPTPPLRDARRAHAAALLPNGKVLVVGSDVALRGTSEIYDPLMNMWTDAAAGQIPPVYVNREDAPTATVLTDGRVLVVGSAGVQIYDPVEDRWANAAPLNVARNRNHTATLLVDGRVLVAGGDSLGTSEVYDPRTNTWSAPAAMRARRSDHTATPLGDGQVLVAGGGTYPAYLTTTERYDPGTNSWTDGPPMAGARGYHSATPLQDGRILVAGGDYPGDGTTIDPQVYDEAPPTITAGPAATNITVAGATVTWATSQPTSGRVEYGTTTAYGSAVTGADGATQHSVALAQLAPGTTYYFKVTSFNGNGTTTGTGSFATAALPPSIVGGPTVAYPAAGGATIDWTTDQASSTRLDYGPTTAYGSVATGADGVAQHAVTPTGLTAGATYQYRVTSANESGSATAIGAFTAAYPVPTVGAVSPGTVRAGGEAFTLTVDGTGFTAGATVRWNGAARPTTFVGATRLTAMIGAGEIAAAGVVTVTVENPSPTAGSSAGAMVAITAAPTPSPTPSPSNGPSPSPSPGAPVPTFADVPGDHWARDQIGQFAARGITTGCGTDDGGNPVYCPERGVTRAEMAVFLTRTLGQDRAIPPATPTFADVPADHWAFQQIEAFVRLGISTGCGTDELGRRIYCPERGVTRAEMAAFVVRAKGQEPLTTGTPTFADVPATYWAYGQIEQFLALGVTTGCGTDEENRRIYCPERGVTRAEMAAFIIRAYP